MNSRPHNSNRRSGSRPGRQVARIVSCSGAMILVLLGLAAATQAAATTFDVLGLPVYDEIGGDDVLIAVQDSISSLSPPSMDIAANGDIFVAIEVQKPGPDYEIHVYRSQDGGDSWDLWGIKSDPNVASQYRDPAIHVANSGVDRFFLAYRYITTTGERRINVSYCDPTLATASFVVKTVMDSTGNQFGRPHITTDEADFSPYYVYLVAEGSDGNGTDIWFARSRFGQGEFWEEEYKIADLFADNNRHYGWPQIEYGWNNQLHCTWYFYTLNHVLDEAVRYRRATNLAGFGIDDWGDIVLLTPNFNNVDEYHPTLVASHTSDTVVLTYDSYDRGAGTLEEGKVWPSYDGGLTWSAADIDSTPDVYWTHDIHTFPDGSFARVSSQGWNANIGIQRGSATTPIVWSDHESLVDRNYQDGATAKFGSVAAPDPTRENRLGVVWLKIDNTGGPDSLFFDAEWRSDPGYPNLEPGFPMALAAGVISPPGICELDGDPESEIVFGDWDGYVHVVNHDGSPLPGWPVNIVGIPADGQVAVGDLDGDGHNEIVSGNTEGKIFVHNADGSNFPGWPVKLDQTDSAYVCIGRLTATSNRQVVVTVGRRLYLLAADGSVEPGFPIITGYEIRAPAAIGDVDNNGTNDIVILQEQFMNVITATGGVQAYRNFGVLGKTFSNAPTLADIDLDDDLEIVAPTDQGDVYVMQDDGSDLLGWPFSDPANEHITSVALANNRALFEPELSFASLRWTVHSCFHDGSEMSGYPVATGENWYLLGMPIMDSIDEGAASVIVPARDQYAYAWDNFGNLVHGWPVALPGPPTVSAASGDIDADGILEVVFATRDFPYLVIYDVGGEAQRGPGDVSRTYWPMYGYNPERQGCLACGSDDVTDVPEETQVPASLFFVAPTPNPSGPPVHLRFGLPTKATVSLALYDVRGRRVRQLVDTTLNPGTHVYSWDGRDNGGSRLAAGIFYARLTTDAGQRKETIVRKMVLLK